MTSKNAVLIISGGGFMGIGPARYLMEMEAALRRLGYQEGALGSCLSLVSGTSVGAIVAALVAVGYSPESILQMFRDHLGKIFGSQLWAYRLLKNGPKYDDAYVVNLLKAKLGGITMDRTAVPLYLTAWDARKKDLKVFGPKDIFVPVWYAVRCSMAASTYFSPMPGYSVTGGTFTLDGEGRYGDGGFAANDPALCGLAAGFEDRTLQAQNLKVFELVTSGRNPESGAIGTGWNILTTLSKVVLPAITSGNSSDVNFIARAWLRTLKLPGGNVFQVRPDTDDYSLDATEKAPDVENIWGQQWNQDAEKALALLLQG